MGKRLTNDEFFELDREHFTNVYNDFVLDFFHENYGNLFEVQNISLGDYFDQIEDDIEKYKSFKHIPNYVLSRDAVISVLTSLTDIFKVDEIDLSSGSDLGWQMKLYAELNYFFDFFKMPLVTPSISLNFK